MKLSVSQKVLILAVLPLVVLGIAVLIVSHQKVTHVVTETIENGLRGSATSIVKSMEQLNDEPYYIGENDDLYKGEFDITKFTGMADELKLVSNTDITVFYGRTRYMTSVLNDNGERAIRTEVDDQNVIENVLNKCVDYFNTNVTVR